ncbi:MAG: Stk1 family PASTA domain-containing Ser/Thr kinase [Firmicutes bacterium]|nr:Stk1 family PASTA domain-containing Ser/Thr kinase [Bacillota bacterium]
MLEAGRVLGRRYEILEEIGSGGMAIVYKARDYKLSRLVAIKVLKQEFALDETILNKFKKEALAAGSLTHPNIVAVYDLGHEIGCDYIVMEYIDGITLKEYIKRRDMLSSEEVVKIAIKIAEALKVAHAGGIIHRDIKPQNIMVTPSGDVKVTDFGIAKAATQTTVTATGETLGSVHYLSPEQARGGEVDIRSDLYSLGITMYEMATKELPFTAETPVAVAMKQIHENFPDPAAKAPQLWPGLRDIILKLTQKLPEWRYQSADELIRDMKHLYRNRNYRLRNDNRVASEYGRSTDQIRAEQERERARIAKEREERMKKLRRRRNTIITLAVLALLILLALIFLLKLVLDRLNSSAAPSEPSVQEIVIDENTSASEEWIRDEDSEEENQEDTEEVPDDRFELPSFVGSRFETANDEAADMGLYTNVQTTNDDHYETGVVMAQDPEDGTMVRPGDTITLYVSLGPVQTLSKVPDLFGMTKDEAQARLTEEGLVLGLVSEDYSNSVQEGKVIGQGTEEGMEVAKGTSIDITISKGPQETSEKTGASGTVTISQPFSKAEENGKLMVVAYDADGNASKIYENTVSYSTFSSLGGSIKVNYPAGTTKVEVYLNDNLIMSEEING